jgi:hypothetical protein
MAHGDLHAVSYPNQLLALLPQPHQQSNVFITAEKDACLADFGLTTISDSAFTQQHMKNGGDGAAAWLAPEFLSPPSAHANMRQTSERNEGPSNVQTAPFSSSKSLEGDVFAFGRMCLFVCNCDHSDKSLIILKRSCRFAQVRSPSERGKHPARPLQSECKGGYAMPDMWWELAEKCWYTTPDHRPKIKGILSSLQPKPKPKPKVTRK